MASVARRNQPDQRVVLDRRHSEHGIGNKRVILRRDDQGGDGDRIEHMPGSRAVVIIGSALVSSIGGGIPIIECADSRDDIKAAEVPFAWEQRRFPAEPRLQLCQKVAVINPIARHFQRARADGRVDIGTDGCDAGQGRLVSAHLTGCFEDEIAAHRIADQPDPVESVLLNQFLYNRAIVAAQAAVIEGGRQVLRASACSLVHADDVEAQAIGFGRYAAHIAGLAATFEAMDQERRGGGLPIGLPMAPSEQLRAGFNGEQARFLRQSGQ